MVAGACDSIIGAGTCAGAGAVPETCDYKW